MTFPCGKILFLNSFVVVGQQFVHIQGWRGRGWQTLADVAPPRPSMKTLQENWIKKSQRPKRWQIPLSGLPFFFSIFISCFVHFAYLSHALPLSFFLDPHDYLSNIIIKNKIHCIIQCGIKLILHFPSPCVFFFDSAFKKKKKNCSRSTLWSIFHDPGLYIHLEFYQIL